MTWTMPGAGAWPGARPRRVISEATRAAARARPAAIPTAPRAAAAALLALALAAAAPARAPRAQAAGPGAASSATEFQIEAAYLVDFARFTRWPAPSAGPMTVCVIGDDPFGGALEEALRGQKIRGRALVARRLAADGSSGATGLRACSIAFIAASERSRLASLLARLDRVGALTVSNLPGFAASGGMIEFLRRGDHIRFAVNLAAARAAGLDFNSEMLKVALAVLRGPSPAP